jgi:hypothetical protein
MSNQTLIRKESAKKQIYTQELRFWPGMRNSLSRRFWAEKKIKMMKFNSRRN